MTDKKQPKKTTAKTTAKKTTAKKTTAKTTAKKTTKAPEAAVETTPERPTAPKPTGKPAPKKSANGYTPRLKERYRSEIVPRLQEELGLENVMEVPGIEKIVVNMGVGDAAKDAKLIEGALKDLTTITGQKPALRRARKSIATFKIREGMPVGASVTIRGDRMWDFLDRLLSVVLPRIRDFRGLNPSSFDGRGNYSLGLNEQLVFPEIDYDDIDATRGMDITIVTTARNDDEGRGLLSTLGFPFRQAGGGG